MRKLLALTIGWVGLSFMLSDTLQGCPFCAAVQQTLRQEMSSMDAVVLAKIVGKGASETEAEFEILEVVKGGELIKSGKKIRAAYFGTAPADSSFLIMGVDPPDLLWSSPLPVSSVAIDYVKAISKLPDSIQTQLEFYLGYLENGETLLARDAYDEFAQAPYPDVKLLKDKMNRQQVLKWIRDANMPPDRKRLYLVMLGICGKPKDAQLLEKLLKSEDPNQRAGLDAMIACYVTLRGADGLGLIEELFLKNKKSQYADTYSAIMALRFHGTEGGVVDKKRVVESLHLILQRPELADLVIPDLARWEDWSQIDRLVELFKKADDKTSWVRVPVINYLRACPLPEAAERLKELQELDPAAFKRATSFFPIPQPASPTPKQSSSTVQPRSVGNLAGHSAVRDNLPNGAGDERIGSAGRLGVGMPMALNVPLGKQDVLQRDVMKDRSVGAASGLAIANTAPISDMLHSEFAALEPNRGLVSGVVLMAATTVGVALWLAISGAGNQGVFAQAWEQFGNRAAMATQAGSKSV